MTHLRSKQGGVLLLEAMIAILVFSIGVLGLVGLQAVANKQVNDAKFRSDAAFLVNQVIAEMHLSDLSNLRSLYDSSTSAPVKYQAWRDRVVSGPHALIGAATAGPTMPTITVPNTTATTGGNEVTVTVFWQLPNDPVPHTYAVTTRVLGKDD